MIAFVAYLLVFIFLIKYNGFFGLFKDENTSPGKFALLFFFKAMAVPVFYFVYKKMYGGIELFDAGKFYHDATVIGDYAYSSPGAYLRLLFGLQNDTPGSADFIGFLSRTDNWDNGTMKDYFYNDNRVVIRLHSMFHFISPDSYFVHALLNCFLSFAGIVFLYKVIKNYFPAHSFYVLLTLCFFPSLWFYTGAVLKEGIAMFVIGSQVFLIHSFLNGKSGLWRLSGFIFLLFISILLKPYLLLFTTFTFALFLILEKSSFRVNKTVLFFCLVVFFAFLANTASVIFKNRTLTEAVKRHQHAFADMAKGGIFLKDSLKFVRLPYNPSFVKKINGADSLYNIASRATYTYWENSHQQDTLYCHSNTDTVTQFKLAYVINESKSNIDPAVYKKGGVSMLASSLYFSLFYPLFLNARGPMQLLASAENCLLIFSFVLILLGLILNKKSAFLPLVLVFMALSVCMLAGLATPNSGAIFRYRSPVVIYILLAGCYYLNDVMALLSFKRPETKETLN